MASLTPKTLAPKKGAKTTDAQGDAAKSEPPDKPEPKAAFVKQRWEDGMDAIRSELHEYFMNYSFVEGNQWVTWNTNQGRLDDIPRDPKKVRLTINRMRANCRTTMGKVMQRQLTFEVLATDADDSHVRGAKLAESQLENVRLKHKWESLREMISWAALKGGTAAICVEWDANAGDPAASPDDTGGIERKQGDTVETVLNLGEFVGEPGCKDIEYGRWWIKRQLLPPKQVMNTYDMTYVPAADGNTATTPFKLSKMDGTAIIPLTEVLTLYERPNVLCPKGQVVVVVGGHVVFEGEWPFSWTDSLNLAVVRETVVETRWTGSTVLSDARQIQEAFNQSWSTIVEHMKRAGNARIFVPQSVVDQMDDLSDLPGEIFPYPDGTDKPAWGGAPQMPQWWVDQPGMLSEQLDDVMGVHAISRGTAGVNAPDSGYGLSILAEHDSTPVDRLIKELAAAFGRVGTMVLQTYEDMVTNKRKAMIQIPGEPTQTIAWSGDDFRGQTTAIVPEDAILPRSRAGMLEFAKQAMEMGLVTNMADFAFLAELPSSRMMLEGLNPDLSRARRENAGFAQKRQSIPYEWDDHQAHIIEHNRYRKSQDYGLQSEEIQEMVNNHVQAHLTMAAEAIGKQQAASAIGGPGLAGAPTQQGAAPDPALNPINTGIPVPAMPPDQFFGPEATGTAPGAPGAAAGAAPAPGGPGDIEQMKADAFAQIMAQLNQGGGGLPQ